jgi:hypothetical protein
MIFWIFIVLHLRHLVKYADAGRAWPRWAVAMIRRHSARAQDMEAESSVQQDEAAGQFAATRGAC